MINIRYCKKCGKAFDQATNLKLCKNQSEHNKQHKRKRDKLGKFSK